MSAASGADLCDRLGIPFLWAVHESVPPSRYWREAYGRGGSHPAVEQRGLDALRSAQQVIFEATATLELFRGAVDDACLTRIPYGVDTALIDDYLAKNERAPLRREA